MLEGLRGEDSIAELCRKEGIAHSLYYTWSKEFMEAGKRRLAGDTARAATTDEVKDLRREASALKKCVADLTLETQIEAFVEHYNHQRYHESLNNVTPADAYFGGAPAILKQRERIKRQTIEHQRLQHRKLAA